jgi:hypothetical protein
MTPTTIPALPSDCTVVQAAACWVNVYWELDFQQTFLEFRARPGPGSANPSNDSVSVRILRGMERDNQTLSSGREVNYECDSSDKCNSPESLQKVLSALTVEDQFQQEIGPILKLIFPFNPRDADCVYFHNTTFRCPPPDLRRCRRCLVEAGQQQTRGEDVCATCEVEEARDNFVERFKLFSLNDPSRDVDVAGIGCQLKGCNTVSNVNRVFQASTIKFNTEKFRN